MVAVSSRHRAKPLRPAVAANVCTVSPIMMEYMRHATKVFTTVATASALPALSPSADVTASLYVLVPVTAIAGVLRSDNAPRKKREA